jgi:hypothetical protein
MQTRPTVAAAKTRTAAADAAGAMRRRLQWQRPNEQAPYSAVSTGQAEAPYGTELYQQQRTMSMLWCFLHVYDVYVVNACAGYRGGLVMAVWNLLGARLGSRAN